jgi:hypothetical protein
MTLVTELPYVTHPNDGSVKPTAQNLRQLKLQIDGENKFLATVIMEEWEKLAGQLDSASPFYRKIAEGVIAAKENLHEGLASWPQKSRDILFNPAYAAVATEGERFNVYLIDRFYVLCHSYEFVRLLKASAQTGSVIRATERLERVFDDALDEMASNIDFDEFKVIDCGALARVQLGSGLVVLNSILEARNSHTAA